MSIRPTSAALRGLRAALVRHGATVAGARTRGRRRRSAARAPILLLLSISATDCALPEASPDPAPAAACEPASDVAPVRWENTVVRWPSLSLGGGRGYVVGIDLGVLDYEPIRQPPLQVLSLDGGRIDPPPGDFWFLYPIGATDREGRLHLVWAEPHDTPTRPVTHLQWPGVSDVRSLWYSRLEPATGWTPPERIHEGAQLDWSPPNRALVADRQGHVHLLAPHVFGALVHLAWDEDGWRSEVASPRVYPMVVDLAVDGEHGITVVSAGDLFGGLGWATANVRLSTEEDGNGWSVPRILDEGETNDQRLIAVGDSLHLLTGRGELFGLGSIEHRVSRDGGRTWTMRAPLRIEAPSGSWASFDAAADGCGRLHVFYHVVRFDGDGPDPTPMARLWHTVDAGNGWSTPTRVSPGEPVVTYDVVTTPAGTLQLFLSRFPAGGGPGDPIHSAVMEWPVPASAGEGR